MFLVGMISWWYGNGWKDRISLIKNRIALLADEFSIDLLLKTFFSTYKQISAGQVDGNINVRIRAFFDRLISRFIGAFIRFFVILVGVFIIAFQVSFGIIELIFWLLIPFIPIIGAIIFVLGWTI